MTPQEITAHLKASRTDAPQPFALVVPREFQPLVARTFHATHHADATDMQIVLRSLEDQCMPSHVVTAITDALKEEAHHAH